MSTWDHIDRSLERFGAAVSKRAANLEAALAKLSRTKPCPKHGRDKAVLDEQKAREFIGTFREGQVSFYTCRECEAERIEQEIQSRLRAWNVPPNLLGCTFANWIPRNQIEAAHLSRVREFSQALRGFLIMLGGVGLGKTHLEVATMRDCHLAGRNALMFKQSTLLRALRATYQGEGAADPINQCTEADLLVLDEFGLSPGGKDEFPMLHEILDARYGAMKPTIISSNFDQQQFVNALGLRLWDRVAESVFEVLLFSGPSHRAEMRDRYFSASAPSAARVETVWEQID